MREAVTGGVLAAALMTLVAAPVALAQSSPPTATLQDDVAAIKKQLEAVQRELQEIKSLLRERAGAPGTDLRGITLGLGETPFKGAADARVTLVEFTDYQCPFCARHHRDTMPRIVETYVKTGKLKYVVRDFPLDSIHPLAAKAAEGAHCAAEGGKYWDMHDRLFADSNALGPNHLIAHAQALGLDADAFRRCLDSGKYATRVNEARAEGLRAGVRGTPSFFLGFTEPDSGKITPVMALRGALPYAQFEEAIEKLLAAPR